MAKRFDFSGDTEPIELVYNDQIFLVAGEAPADTIADLSKMLDADTDTNRVDAMKSFMFQILLPEYIEPYRERLADPKRPIGFSSLMKSFEILVAHYTRDLGGDDESARPTEEASLSPSGESAIGENSTPSSSSEAASTPAGSLSVVSST